MWSAGQSRYTMSIVQYESVILILLAFPSSVNSIPHKILSVLCLILISQKIYPNKK